MSIKHVSRLCNHNKVMLQIWKFSEDKTVVNIYGWGEGGCSWHALSCEIVLNQKYIFNAATPTHSMWYAYFSLLSGFTFHTLSSLGILGTGDLKWLRAERNLRGIQLAPCSSELRFLYGCVITEKRTGGIGRCWERGEEKKRREEKRTRERKSRQSWFSVTPPQASSAIFNTQAYVLSNLSRPGF